MEFCFDNLENHCSIGRMLYIILVVPLLYSASALEFISHIPCGTVPLHKAEGTITSPNYPLMYPGHVSCTWIIQSPPRTVLTIRVWDLDIEEDSSTVCNVPPCCLHAWLSVPRDGGHASQQLCNRDNQDYRDAPLTVSVSQPVTTIKFHSSKFGKEGRGFNLTYIIEPEVLCRGRDEVPCGDRDPGCYNNITQRCNNIRDCVLGRDEADCGSCGRDHYPCVTVIGCYSQQQLCDGKPDCADYSDETNCGWVSPSDSSCPGKILCADHNGCYSVTQQCDMVRNCADGSDEEDCPREPREPCTSIPGKFQCDNGQCISDICWCNGVDDCTDHSDEFNCIKNSVITAAVMGSLICGLLLVIAVGCMCRLYSLRLATGSTYRVDPPAIPHPDHDFFHREPPPAYSVAIGDMQRLPTPSNGRLFTVSASEHNLGPRPHTSRRSARRHSNRRRVHRAHPTLPPSRVPIPTLETSLEAQRESMILSSHAADKSAGASHTGTSDSPVDTISASCVVDVRPEGEVSSPPRSSSTSTSGSPSRESITSSTSLLSYLSGNDDDTQLLVLPPS